MKNWYEASVRELKKDNKIWSVSLEAANWADDLYNGTFEECTEYARDNGYKLDGIEGKLVLIDTEDGYCYDMYTEKD